MLLYAENSPDYLMDCIFPSFFVKSVKLSFGKVLRSLLKPKENSSGQESEAIILSWEVYDF